MSDQAERPDPLNELLPAAAEVQGDTPQGQDAAATPDAGTAPEGQGQAGGGLYDLTDVPEELRPHVERIAKDIDRNVNAKLAEAAEFRKQYEPFTELGLQDYDPEGVAALLQFARDLAEPESAVEALQNLAASLELDLTQGAETAPAAPADPDDEVRQRLERVEAWRQQQEEERQYAEFYEQESERLRAEFAQVEAAHGAKFSEQEKTRLVELAQRFRPDHDEPIKAAYNFLNEVAGAAEKDLVTRTPKAPRRAEGAGRASSTVKPVDNFDDAERIHRERNATHA